MCGISGFVNLKNKNFQVDEQLLINMQKTLAHRGPDDKGFWKSDIYQIGLVHTRLSIIDLSFSGHQPMFDKEKSVVISFNGEIYNHKVLRFELENLGHRYFSQTDTETLIYAYKEWGIDFIHKLDGMFAISIFDLKKKEFFLIRDRIGIKPIYFSIQGGVFSFSSEIKALWNLHWVKKSINNKAVYDYLTFMVTPAPNTIYKDIFKLQSGFYLKIDSNKNLNLNKWYSPLKSISKKEKKELENEVFCLDNIENLLIDSIKKRMISDIPVGAFLSGGIDSSLNVALMAQFSKNIKTFTIAFENDRDNDELKWARLISKKFGTDHHEIVISEKEAFNFFEKMIYHLDEPLADCVCIPFYYISKLAKDCGISVVQVGEGADELFFGYPSYLKYKKFYDKFWKISFNIFPRFFKKFLYKSSKYFLPKHLDHLELLSNWSNNMALFWTGAMAFNEHQKKKILNFDVNNLGSFSVVEKHLKTLKSFDFNSDIIKQMTYLELQQRLPELLLMRTDKMAMAASVETRVPFLDYKLVEFMLNVPARLKVKNNQTKYLLKKVAEKYLPKEVIYRKKVGFGAPIINWYKNGNYFSQYYQNLIIKNLDKNEIFLPVIKNLEKSYHHHNHGFAVQKWTIQNLLALNEI